MVVSRGGAIPDDVPATDAVGPRGVLVCVLIADGKDTEGAACAFRWLKLDEDRCLELDGV